MKKGLVETVRSRTMTKQRGSFCDFSLEDVRILGLRPELVEMAEETYKLVLIDKQGPKWEIRPITFQNGTRIPTRISLYHRNTGNPGMHYQKVSRNANKRGVKSILQYIINHELYEKSGR